MGKKETCQVKHAAPYNAMYIHIVHLYASSVHIQSTHPVYRLLLSKNDVLFTKMIILDNKITFLDNKKLYNTCVHSTCTLICTSVRSSCTVQCTLGSSHKQWQGQVLNPEECT